MAVAVQQRKRQSLGNAKVREASVGYAFVILPLGFFFLFLISGLGIGLRSIYSNNTNK